jgi:hypothetical protein
MSLELDSNPIQSRTDADLFRDVRNEMDSLGLGPWLARIWIGLFSRDFTFVPPNIWDSENLKLPSKMRPRESPGEPRLGLAWGLECARRNGSRICESGGLGLRIGPGSCVWRGRSQGCRGEWGWQIFRFLVFREADLRVAGRERVETTKSRHSEFIL